MGYTVSSFDQEEQAADAFSIRKKVFGLEQKIPEYLDHDADDPTSFHVVIYKNDVSPVATGRLSIKKPTLGQLSRIVVVQEERGNGLSRKVINALEEIAVAHGVKRLFLHPHDYLQAFYEKLGYQRSNDKTIRIASMNLVEMHKDLSVSVP